MLIGLSTGCASAPPHGAPAAGSTVTSEDFQDPNESIEQVLQKKVPALLVTRTSNGGIALQIRGSSSYNGSATPPLYVLNGLPFQPGPDGALTGIDAHNIESIKVLKGAEAGLYGIQGANGVIVITTKQPGKRSP
ncbi:MAG TPA: TonB-dependent receptor plug domain-containing protein [Candidatus Elarobacter sp.]|nr:TonB-dependent receptor plug domain-containing protein [Candidatus Elarobacter sp.]